MRDSAADLTGRTAIVTGACGGIGSAICQTLRVHGAKIVALDLCPPDSTLFNTAEMMFRSLDIADLASFQALVAELEANGAGPDILVNNAGLLTRSSFLQTTQKAWDAALDVNLRAAVFACQAVADGMARRKSGAIVNLSSYAGLKARANCLGYAAAKAGLHHATKCLAVELGPLGIRVNAIAPGYIDTPMTRWMHEDPALKAEYIDKTPLRRLGAPSDIANGVLFLVSALSSFVTGHTLVMDGGIIHG